MVDGWQRSTLGEHVRIFSGNSPSQVSLIENGYHPFVKVEDLNNCKKYQNSGRAFTNERKFCAPAGSIIFPKRGAAILNNKIRIATVDIAMDTNLMALQPGDMLDCEFLFYLIQREGLFKIADTSTIPQLNNKHINPYEFLLPPLPEQRRIAEILRTWDEAIEKLEALRLAKQRRLDGLTHALILGKLGMNGQRRNWQPTRLSEVTFELTARNTNLDMGHAAVMGVTKARGVVPMREQTIGSDLSRYKRLPPRAFAYNPMRINVGSIAMNDRDEEVLVSPDYVVFGCTENGLAPDFLDHLRKTHWWSHYINIGGSGSVRMRTYYDDLAAMKLPLPAYGEQLEIVAVLNAAQEDVEATEKASKALAHQKRGLMQKLLTGEWRVKR